MFSRFLCLGSAAARVFGPAAAHDPGARCAARPDDWSARSLPANSGRSLGPGLTAQGHRGDGAAGQDDDGGGRPAQEGRRQVPRWSAGVPGRAPARRGRGRRWPPSRSARRGPGSPGPARCRPAGAAGPGSRHRPAAPDEQVRHHEGQQRPAPGQRGPLGLEPGVPGGARSTRHQDQHGKGERRGGHADGHHQHQPENGSSRLFRMAASICPQRR